MSSPYLDRPLRSLAECQAKQSRGRAAYEADVKARPTYHDGKPRRTWEQLGPVERWSWERPDQCASS